jgi:ribonuclease D
MKHPWTFVNTPAQLKMAEETIRMSDIICIDTEYDSFRYFRDKLCLIQIQTGEKTWLIDPLADLDLSFLGNVLNDRKILKIFHAGDNDIRILKRDFAFAFRNIFDTHRAASLLGYRQLALGLLLNSSTMLPSIQLICSTFISSSIESSLKKSWRRRRCRYFRG